MPAPSNNSDAFIAWVTLSMIPRIGGKLLATLLASFGDPTAVLQASYKDLRTVPGIGHKTAESIVSADQAQVARQLTTWERKGIQILSWDDDRYPHLLQTVDDRPPVLFALGDSQAAQQRHIALVGTRSPSPQAKFVTAQLGYKLAEAGWNVVSGLALGIDTAAHQSVLAHRKRRATTATQAVVGCGVDVIYPAENRALRNRLLSNGGAIFSEVAPGTAPTPPLLVARNRIITGMAAVVVVVESNSNGGAMHAARFARVQGRELWTVDYPQATGNQQLIADGCKRIAGLPDDLTRFVAQISESDA